MAQFLTSKTLVWQAKEEEKMRKIFKFYVKDGHFHLERTDQFNQKLLEKSTKYEDIVESFIRQTGSSDDVKKYRQAMEYIKQQESSRKEAEKG